MSKKKVDESKKREFDKMINPDDDDSPESFIAYVLSFYGVGGIYKMKPPATQEEVVAALAIRMKHQDEYKWGADSTDRELVRDAIHARRGVSADDLEYRFVARWLQLSPITAAGGHLTRKVYVVWLIYPNEPPRLTAVFSKHDAATEYATRRHGDKGNGSDPFQFSGYRTKVTVETVYASADDL